MRWDDLFDDLEGQLEQERAAEAVDLRAEEERLRLGRIPLRDRLSAIAAGELKGSSYSITLQLVDGTVVRLRPTTFGKDWLAADLLDSGSQKFQCVLPLAAIVQVMLSVEQVPASLQPDRDSRVPAPLADRIGLTFVLRDLARRRANVDVFLPGITLHGTIDRVGRDHLDLAVHEPGTPRRQSNVRECRLVPLERILLVRL